MRILIVDTAYPINSRTDRFVKSITQNFPTAQIKIVCWNRDDKPTKNDPDYHIYTEKADYGNRLAKLLSLRGFYSFLKQSIQAVNPDIILASHWDSLWLTSMAKRKNMKLIYENLDMPTGKPLIRLALMKLEKLALKKTDCITFASRFYLPYYNSFKGQKIIIENKLPKKLCSVLPIHADRNTCTITFLGCVRYPDILKNLIRAIDGIQNVELKIFGNGESYSEIKEFSSKVNNVFMYGEYDYSSVPKIYEESDIIWAAYPSEDFNVKLAISNKYHESLHYKVPAIFSEGTELGKMVQRNSAGFTVNPYSVEEIRNLIIEIVSNYTKNKDNIKNSIEQLKQKENSCWEEEVKPFIDYLNSMN